MALEVGTVQGGQIAALQDGKEGGLGKHLLSIYSREWSYFVVVLYCTARRGETFLFELWQLSLCLSSNEGEAAAIDTPRISCMVVHVVRPHEMLPTCRFQCQRVVAGWAYGQPRAVAAAHDASLVNQRLGKNPLVYCSCGLCVSVRATHASCYAYHTRPHA